VLRCIDFSESSQVVALITPELGQVRGLAKGSRRPRRDGRLPLEALTQCDVVLAQKGAGQLHIVAEWTLRETFPRLATDLSRLWRAFYADEVTMAFATETAEDGIFYGRLLDLLRRLDRGGEAELALFRFLTQALEASGHRPLVEACAQCRGPLEGTPRFSPGAGGALCGNCGRGEAGAFAISRGALAVMGRLAARSDREVGGLRLNAAQVAEIRRAFNEQMQYYLGRPLRTARFLAASAGMGRPAADQP